MVSGMYQTGRMAASASRKETTVESTSRMCVVMAAFVMLVAGAVYAADDSATVQPVELKTDFDKSSYALGVQMAISLKRPGMEEVDIEMLIRGLRDVMADRNLALSDEEQQQVMTGFRTRLMAKQREAREKETKDNLAAAQAFLEENAKKEGVIVLPSGLQYKVLRDGTGRTPTETDRVKTNYRGMFIDGTEFDNSYKRGQPSEFDVTGVIPGWTEALKLMKEGAKWELYIPADLAYGPRGRPPRIPPNSALVFEMELIEIVEAAK